MNVHMRILLSFVALLALAVAIQLAIALPRAIRARRNRLAESESPADADRRLFPKRKAMLVESLILVPVITIGITLVITFVLQAVGFLDRQFYRPSHRDYEQAAKLGITYEDISLPTADGETLHGWWIPAAGAPKGTVIHFHGSDRNISYTVRNVAWMTAHRWNVFAFDYRGYGKSTGTPSREGLIRDGLAALDYVHSRPDVEPESIVLFGQSMGGQLAITTAAQSPIGDRLGAVVSEATYARHSLHVADKLSSLGPLWLVQWSAWLLTSDDNSAEDAIADLPPVPVLLVHGSIDRGCRPYHSERLYDAAGEPKAIWRMKGERHLTTFQAETNQARLIDYLNQHVGVDRAASPSRHGAQPPDAPD